MRRQLLSLGRSKSALPAISSLTLSQRCLSSFSLFSSSPLLASAEPTTSEPTTSTPESATAPSSTLSARSAIHRPQRLWTPDYVSPTKHVMNYLTQHGPQTRRTLYAIFGPAPTAPTSTATTPSAASSTSTAAAEAIAASPVVQSHPSCLRSKTHLTTLLQQLSRSGRVTTRRAPAADAAPGAARASKKSGGLFVYEMRDYETSWNKIRHEKEKGQKGRRKQERLRAKAEEDVQRAATKERRRLRLESGMGAKQ